MERVDSTSATRRRAYRHAITLAAVALMSSAALAAYERDDGIRVIPSFLDSDRPANSKPLSSRNGMRRFSVA